MTQEKAILAGFRLRDEDAGDPNDPYIELERLADTSGAEGLETITQTDRRPTPQFFIGPGKVKEIRERVDALEVDCVIFNHELSPMQFRNLERELEVKIIDRTQLILDIFAMRAQSMEGKIQVELAQLEYLLPRIAGHGVEMSRLGGGIGTRGPGETKLEVDRRRIRDRIAVLKRKLAGVEKTRRTQNRRRLSAGTPLIALVGYTNAGKSTLFNALTRSDTFVEDKLFATLDPLTRRVYIPNVGEALITDTVGFIKNLPPKLMQTFKSTLEGISDAGLLLHVVDAGNPAYQAQINEVDSVIDALGAADIPQLLVINKIDLPQAPERAERLLKVRNGAVVSAKKDKEFALLKSKIAEVFQKKRRTKGKMGTTDEHG